MKGEASFSILIYKNMRRTLTLFALVPMIFLAVLLSIVLISTSKKELRSMTHNSMVSLQKKCWLHIPNQWSNQWSSIDLSGCFKRCADDGWKIVWAWCNIAGIRASAEEVSASCQTVMAACTDTQASTEEMRAINENVGTAIEFFKLP